MTEVAKPEPQQQVDPSPVEDLMRLMAKCQRAIILYQPNNPVYQEATEKLQAALRQLWPQMDELLLRVRDDGFTWHGHDVLEEPSKGDSMAWVLYKDGVMAVRMTPGTEDEELIEFLDLIHNVRTLPDDAEDDLRTLLWAKDFQKIKCDLAVIGTDNARPLERSEHFEAAPAPGSVQQVVAREIELPEGFVALEDIDSDLYFLDETEVRYLNGEIEREYEADLPITVLSMLFDILELEREPAVADDVVAILDEFLPYLLGVGDIHAVSYILREARTVTERAGRLEEGMRDRLAAFAAKISHPEALDQLLETLNESETLPADEDLAGLFAQLQPQALETVIMWLPRLESVRASKIGGPEIEDLSSHNDTDVRRALADALGAVGTPEAMMQLESLLDDGAREVRIRAVKQLEHHPDALPRIEAIALAKPMRSKDLSEKRAFFETYGNLVGEKGVARLRPLLTKRLFRFRADPQIRACAAMALGEIGTAEAVAVLEKAKKDKEPLVRAAVNEALKEIES
jgi:hypothetical protein